MRGGLKAREARLAFWMLLPTFSIVIAIVILPVVANFWIAFKPIQLGDLRPPKPAVRESVRAQPKAAGEVLEVRYRVQNRTDNPITWVRIEDALAPGLTPAELPEACRVHDAKIVCELPEGLEPKQTVNLTLRFTAGPAYFAAGAPYPRDTRPVVESKAPNPILARPFTLDNFRAVLTDPDFWPMLKVTLAYTVFGTVLSILLGLFAAQLLSPPFAGRQVLRGLFLFPYVAPVIAVAFTWVFLLDPFAGTINALLLKYGFVHDPIPFLSQRYWPVHFFGMTIQVPLALTMVILFEGWRYFPFAFLFILARLQAIPSELYEAARVDGAGIWATFRYVTLPQVVGILATLFLLRFIWTFNKFDDIFLLTGGAAGTETITIKVYDYAFARANLGQGAAQAVILFAILALFLIVYFRYAPKGEV